MLKKIILLPFSLVTSAVGLVFNIVKLFFSSLFGIGRFVFSRIFGTAFGALVGLFLGGSHIGVKFWKKKKTKKTE
jgi:hypothetical protein